VAFPPLSLLAPEPPPEAPPLDVPESGLFEPPTEEHPLQMVTSAPKESARCAALARAGPKNVE
jgi:hypothetical protein